MKVIIYTVLTAFHYATIHRNGVSSRFKSKASNSLRHYDAGYNYSFLRRSCNEHSNCVLVEFFYESIFGYNSNVLPSVNYEYSLPLASLLFRAPVILTLQDSHLTGTFRLDHKTIMAS